MVLAGGTAAAVGGIGAAVVLTAARRAVAVAAVAAPLVVVASVAAGVVVSAQAMFLSAHDLTVVLLVLAGAGPVALLSGVALARRVRSLDRRAAEDAAGRQRDQDVEATRREMLAWASHDLRTPLAGIRAMAESLEDGVIADKAGYHRRIRDEADRMAVMVDDLVALARIQSGTLRLAREQVSLADLVSDTIASARPLASSRSINLTGAADGPVHAVVDTRALSRALTNLVVNALRHTPADGAVAVTARADGDAAVLTVSDGCGGIADADLPRLFEPGWRGTRARTPAVGEGAGLGLAIVRGVVEAHAGQVGVQNVDGGCQFEVRLPVVNSE